jgi:VIT1/CCC1 family predicted Fe2+/Mn2+ transporter
MGVRAVLTITASGIVPSGSNEAANLPPAASSFLLVTSPGSRHVLEDHKSHRVGWLRAAVLGANDGIVSTAGLVIGVAAASTSRSAVFTAGIAGLVAGAMSMAAGEYISVSSQRDAEDADVKIEAEALKENPRGELRELAKIYEERGVEPGLARLVAEQLMAHDELGAHMRDELGITEIARARPFQAAWTSALSFTAGAIFPLVAILVGGTSIRIGLCVVVTLVALVVLGALGATAGGAPWKRAAARVVLWSSLAMALTYGIGTLVGRNI